MSDRWWYSIFSVFLALLAGGAGLAIARSHGVDVPLLGSDDASRFEGRYTTGFEVSSFVPCDRPEVQYWLTWEPPIDLTSKLPAPGPGYREAFLEIEGELGTGSPIGYGHLGQYDGELLITKVISVTADGSCN